jgi:hypothetical protein
MKTECVVAEIVEVVASNISPYPALDATAFFDLFIPVFRSAIKFNA